MSSGGAGGASCVALVAASTDAMPGSDRWNRPGTPMSVAAAKMTMSASAPARKDGEPPATASLALVVLRAASFVGESERSRFFAFFTRTDIFLNETRRSERSTLSRYVIERVERSVFLKCTVLFLNDPAVRH